MTLNTLALYDYLQKDELLHIFTAIGILILAAVLAALYIAFRRTRRELAGTQDALDTAVAHSARQAEEVRGWRDLFGPFVSLYQNSPETQGQHDHDGNTVAIDLDGVILTYVDPWNGVFHFGDPMPGVVEGIRKLMDMGFKIVVYTTRNNSMAQHNSGRNALELTALVQNELEKGGIPYDFIALFKPLARYYLDDRAVHFASWPQAVDSIKHLEVGRLIDRANVLDRITEGGAE